MVVSESNPFQKSKSVRVKFENDRRLILSGVLDLPVEQEVEYFAIFAHCFTCTKDLKATARISRHLAQNGIGVLRFDFSGLGNSQGVFSETNFETNCDDLRAAADFLTTEHRPPSLLIGHSLGGAAIFNMANEFESVEGICTIGTPSNTHHLAEFLLSQNSEIESSGQGKVNIGGREHLISMQMIESLRRQSVEEKLANLTLPILVFHSPDDKTLAYDHAKKIFETASGPVSVITLNGSDHLLVNQPGDTKFVAEMITLWIEQNIAK